MDKKDSKPEWIKPELTVLCPDGLKENVLTVTGSSPPPPPRYIPPGTSS